ncbi:TAXI family TRAP transporter solute-binding subunit [Salipiger marinus]|uniref:TAXI family TRAP transporter solute-binding subunit n=1 Tax=Salipiger marinus TaxID=555512 RepID=UPI001E636DA5|nr:TAXI family TRAP transporter solute-binding subunit [Salipiger manganoxidans]MCD1617943.1 TAXI family TRAP transporter solute-binding subunit [Salipiger manganoxidans]MEB3418620.1 TAXI family TRAP transporter solute-binding subunit [Salipiger manganoxidans]
MKHAFAALLGATLLAGPALAQDTDLLIGSTSASSSHYGYFVAVGQIINENAEGLRASVVETGATMDNIRRMARGQVDLGLVTTNTAQHAYSGTKDFEGNAQDLRLLWVYSNAPQNVVVRQDAGVDSLEALAEVRFNPGIKGSATESTTEAVFDTLGLTADYVRGSTTDIVDAIKDNRVAGYVKSGSGLKLDGSTMDVATTTDIAVLGLSPEQADTLRTEMPDLAVVDIPEGAAEGVPAYTTWAFGVGVAAPSSMDADTAYAIVSAVMADQTAQANAMASLKDESLAQMTLDYGSIPLHPGAARWFEEQGIEIPAKLKAE